MCDEIGRRMRALCLYCYELMCTHARTRYGKYPWQNSQHRHLDKRIVIGFGIVSAVWRECTGIHDTGCRPPAYEEKSRS